jgi:catechol 2,3-dioxygenase-like lactoylglutathione lyase family enzyme
MIDHLEVAVSNLARSKDFYARALAPLGYALMMEIGPPVVTVRFAGFGDRKPDLWLAERGANRPGLHVAFLARDRAAVDSFHAAALAAGGRDNGKPGLRPHYHANYYGAFVLDPDGHNIEAVCHKPPG